MLSKVSLGRDDTGAILLRARVWIDGEVKFEDVFPPMPNGAGFDAVAHSVEQMRLIVEADSNGVPWFIEIFDPGQGADQQPFRFGTDTQRMAHPVELPEP